MRLQNKTAIITGGASGFGAATVLRFVEEGARVVIADLDIEKAEALAAQIRADGGSALAQRCNVALEADWDALLAATLNAYERLDIVVNNAGTTHRNQPSLEVSEEDFDRVYRVNLKSIFWSARKVMPGFRSQGAGVMINVASATGVRPGPGLIWYSGSKAAMINLTRGLALEFGREGIRVNAINPMIGETAMLGDFMGMEDTPENRQKFLARIPLGRFTQPADVANAAVYLASDEASYLTGVCLDVDGGRCI